MDVDVGCHGGSSEGERRVKQAKVDRVGIGKDESGLTDAVVVNENALQLEEVGRLESVEFSSECFVFSQHWPSWSFALSALACRTLTTAVEWNSTVARKEFESTDLGATLTNMGAAKAKLLNVNKPLVYVQGSKSFVRRILLDLVGKECGLVSAIIPKEVKDKGGSNLLGLGGLTWKQLSHRQVSGATQGTWMLGTSCNIKKHFFWASKVKRNLSHNLSSLESGTVVPEGKPLAIFHGKPVY